MTYSSQHLAWLARGGHWELCTPGRLLRDTLRAAGYTVYDIGNNTHLDHQPPEDHTPYSETGWPGASPYGVVMAIDVMPGGGPLSLQALGARLHADKKSGKYPPIKYMNWGPVDDAHAVQCRWKPDHVQGSSSDTGHIHISFRTDYADYAVPYNPLEIDMEQSEALNPPNAEGNRVGDALNIATQVRTGLWKNDGATGYGAPSPGSALGKLYAKLDALASHVTELGDDVDTLTATVAAVQAGQVSQAAVDAAVGAALANPAVIAPLVTAINDELARRQAS